MKEQEARGFLNSWGIRTALSQVPLLGPIFGGINALIKGTK